MYRTQLTESYFPAVRESEMRPMTIGAMLRERALAHPDQPAMKELLYSGDVARIWTYAELLRDAEKLARALAGRHAKGARVAVYANNIPEWVLIELGCGLAGITLVTVNPAFQERELKYVLEQSRSEAVYYVAEFRGNQMADIVAAAARGNDAIRHKILLTDHEALFAGGENAALPEVAPEDVVQIQYTSGTTGFPKGALLHHCGLLQNGLDVMIRAGVEPGDVFVHHMPMFHTTGCAIMTLGGLGRGATFLLAPAFDPEMIIRVIERERSKFCLGVPTMLVALIEEVERTGRDVSSVKRMMSGGAMVAPELCRKAKKVFGAPIQIVYGQTESSPVITQTWFDDSEDDLTGTTGQPLPHCEVSIRCPSANKVVGVGEQGEICARGYNIMHGYNDNPEATAKTIDAEGWLHTGDLGTMDARGYVRVTGRVKEMIIRGGENLFPAEIENALLEHPAISEVAVVGVPDDKWGEQVACFIKPADGARLSAPELKSFIRERLSPQKTPAFWICVDAWPLTGSGKIQKFKLAEAFQRGEFDCLKA